MEDKIKVEFENLDPYKPPKVNTWWIIAILLIILGSLVLVLWRSL